MTTEWYKIDLIKLFRKKYKHWKNVRYARRMNDHFIFFGHKPFFADNLSPEELQERMDEFSRASMALAKEFRKVSMKTAQVRVAFAKALQEKDNE